MKSLNHDDDAVIFDISANCASLQAALKSFGKGFAIARKMMYCNKSLSHLLMTKDFAASVVVSCCHYC